MKSFFRPHRKPTEASSQISQRPKVKSRNETKRARKLTKHLLHSLTAPQLGDFNHLLFTNLVSHNHPLTAHSTHSIATLLDYAPLHISERRPTYTMKTTIPPHKGKYTEISPKSPTVSQRQSLRATPSSVNLDPRWQAAFIDFYT